MSSEKTAWYLGLREKTAGPLDRFIRMFGIEDLPAMKRMLGHLEPSAGALPPAPGVDPATMKRMLGHLDPSAGALPPAPGVDPATMKRMLGYLED